MIKEIEDLSTIYQGEFWKLLKQVAGRNARRRGQESAIDEEGNEVGGKEIIALWKKAFEKLCETASRPGEFDGVFESKVEKEVKNIERMNKAKRGGVLDE